MGLFRRSRPVGGGPGLPGSFRFGHDGRIDTVRRDAPLSDAEALGAAALCFPAVAILAAYLGDLAGLRIAPIPILALSTLAAAAAGLALRRRAARDPGALIVFSGVGGGMAAWLIWIAMPELLPLGHGPDLTHHLLLIQHIEREWQLVHDAQALFPAMGEMVQYSPGSHILAALAGAWLGTDGLHASHPVVAASVALKSGLVFLIARRTLPGDAPALPLAVACVLLLFVPAGYFLESFTDNSFFAQIVSETFAVGMWWAAVAWHDRPSPAVALVFAISAIAAFLTWPIWIGPPILALAVAVFSRTDLAPARRFAHLAIAIGPLVPVAIVYASSRLEWMGIVGSGGAVIRPLPARYGWAFLGTSLIGLTLTMVERRSRPIAIFAAAIAAQAAALFLVALASGADAPYMALKMFFLAIYPQAIGVAFVLATMGRAPGCSPAAGAPSAPGWLSKPRRGSPVWPSASRPCVRSCRAPPPSRRSASR
jgi:hypothetical protein